MKLLLYYMLLLYDLCQVGPHNRFKLAFKTQTGGQIFTLCRLMLCYAIFGIPVYG